jgi:hypothetical protein
MNLKEGFMKIIASQSRAVTLGRGLAIAAAVGMAMEAFTPQLAFAGSGCRGCNAW